MINMKKSIGIIGLAAGLASAHLVESSLEPKAGASFKVGDTVSIVWTAQVNHSPNTIDIAFSKNNGQNWTNIRAGYGDNEKQNTFKWKVPADAATTQCKVRICQSGPCTDANNTNRAMQNMPPWVLVSAAFTVQSTTGIAAPAQTGEGLSIDFLAQTGNVDASFALSRAGEVRLQAFDSQGRLVATLIQGNYPAGSHKVSTFSNRLAATSGSFVFKLDAGGITKSLMSLR